MSATVLVTGATGFIGSRLAAALEREGHRVRAMTRRPDRYTGPGEPVRGDVADPASLRTALQGVDAAYYLVHSLDSEDFEQRDAAAASAFGSAAAEAGVRRIVYLGGLGAEEDALSPHLRSRRQVEALLASGGVPVTVLRAAIVVGHGSISWEITRQLSGNLPFMVAPDWAQTLAQPIGVDDVVGYLVGVLEHPAAVGRIFEIGGADVLSYADMLRRASALQTGRKVPVLTLPTAKRGPVAALTAAVSRDASASWLSLLTDVDPATGRNLIASMSTEVVVTDHAIRALVPLEPAGYDAMVRAALAERRCAEETG